MEKIYIHKSAWSAGRQALLAEINSFKEELENHKNTVDVPAPLSNYEFVEQIVRNNLEFVLEEELPWAWKSNGVGKKVSYRKVFSGESLESGETEVNFEPVDYVLDADGVTIRPETIEESLPKLIEERQKYINKERNKYIASGVTFNGWEFDTDTVSINNITSAVAFIKSAPDAGLTPPTTISWRDATNVDRDLTVVQLISLGAVVFQRIQEAHFKARQLKDLIATCVSKEEVMAVDW
jgi:hypothetical protein